MIDEIIEITNKYIEKNQKLEEQFNKLKNEPAEEFTSAEQKVTGQTTVVDSYI